MTELIGFNPLNRRYTTVEKDALTGEDVIVESFDKSHALAVKDRAKDMRDAGSGIGKDMRLACSIPPFVQVELTNQYGMEILQDFDALLFVIKRDYPHLMVHGN